MLLPILPTLLWGLLACEPLGDVNIVRPGTVVPDAVGMLDISHESLEFGDVEVSGEPAERWFTISNTGDGELNLPSLSVESSDVDCFTAKDLPSSLRLAPGDSESYAVHFTPPDHGEFLGHILTDGEPLALYGGGLAPELTLDSVNIDLPQTPVGCASNAYVTLKNSGNTPLNFTDINVSDSSDSSSLFLAEPPPDSLEPGDSYDVALRFAPDAPGHHSGTLSVHSNDPHLSEVRIDLDGDSRIGASHEQSFEYRPRAASDILFVVDSNSSVRNRLNGVETWVSRWFEALEDGSVNWRFSVANFEEDCHVTPEPWYDSYSNTDDAISALSGAFDTYGEGGTRLFELAVSVLERTDDGDCLDNFIRDTSQLHVVLITDRQEESEESVDYYIEKMRSRKGDGELIVSALTGDNLSCPQSTRAVDATEDTNGVLGNLCFTNWPVIFSDLADASAVTNDVSLSLSLKTAPVTSTIEVFAAERPLSEWSYDPGSNSVSIRGSDNDVAVGETLTIRYLAALECP